VINITTAEIKIAETKIKRERIPVQLEMGKKNSKKPQYI
jgi:hypothetical protein